jgi:N-6 DNA Methylase
MELAVPLISSLAQGRKPAWAWREWDGIAGGRKFPSQRATRVVGPNMFYTVTLPCTLWLLDRGKKNTPRADTVLFIDARHIDRQVDRAHRDWTPAQIGFVANLVRLYCDW